MSNIKLITDAAELAKVGKELVSHIKDTDERIAQYLLSEVAHIEEHRNPTRLNLFFSRVKGSGARVNAMHNFIQVFANVSLNKDANGAIKSDGTKNENNKFARDADGEAYAWYYSINKARKICMISTLIADAEKLFKRDATDLRKKGWTFEQHMELAQTKPWYSFQPERPAVAFDADSRLKGAFKAIWTAMLKDGLELSPKAKDAFSKATDSFFEAGVFTAPKDILSDDLIAKVPSEYKRVLHLVSSNGENVTVEEVPATEEPVAPVVNKAASRRRATA